ncbi:hypothetical protein DV736_g5883, partial [Chaetothyriales sp. CBS 134916]
MGVFYEEIPESLIRWIREQRMFWVATAPLSGQMHINVSPKGGDYFGVVDSRTFWYMELTGSGCETLAHLYEPGNGRITIMLSAFDGPPKIVRLWGKGHAMENGTKEFADFAEKHKIEAIPGTRSIIVVNIHQVGSSCGFSVPYYDFKGHRSILNDHFKQKQAKFEAGNEKESMPRYWAHKNAWSMDGLASSKIGLETGKAFSIAPIKKMVGPLAPLNNQRFKGGVPIQQVILIALLSVILGVLMTLHGPFLLLVCIGGIYATFLTWALLQERITTTPFECEPSLVSSSSSRPAAPDTEYFKFPIFLNTIQSLLAFISGTLYLLAMATTSSGPLLLPSSHALAPLLLVAITQTLSSPFGYASLAHVDYLTFVLAKSCKLLPVMFLHVLLYQKRYPFSKYLIVFAVTAGVAIFTLYHPPKVGKVSTKNAQNSSLYGLALLGISLGFDGLTNTTQDHIFGSPKRYGRVTAPQMMAATNLLSCVLMTTYLLITPHVPLDYFFSSLSSGSTSVDSNTTHELASAVAFLQRHPRVLYDVLGFCVAGAIGQLFIFATLNRFGSLVLVTVTVTRKMLTMVLSVVWYGKSLTLGQWAGVGLVFGGIGTEAWIQRQEKLDKERKKHELEKKSD